MLKFLKFQCACLCALAPCIVPTAVHADVFPSRPVKLVHAYPGGAADVMTRQLADKLSILWKQPVIVEPRAGVNEVIAADYVAKSPADGYTLLIGSESTFTNNQYLYSKLPFDPVNDLVPVSHLYDIPFGLVVRPTLPADTVGEFVVLIKKDPNKYSYASTGVGGSLHLGMEAFQKNVGGQLLHVPYKSPPNAIQDLLGGSVDSFMSAMQVPATFLASKRMKVLAVSSAHRLKAFPQIPTFAEAGYPGVDVRMLIGLAAPRGTPHDVVAKLAADVRSVFLSKDFQDKAIDPYGYEVIASDPATFAEYIGKKRPSVQKQLKELALKLD